MEPVSGQRTVDVAADALRTEVLRGGFSAGSFLPAERQLAETLGISRLTLRAALARLQGEGLVQPEQGRGVRVCDWRVSAGIEVVPALVQALGLAHLADFLALRRAVACEAVALAAERATEAQLDALHEEAERLATLDTEALVWANLSFAERVVALADNVAMRLLFNTVSRVFEGSPDLARALLLDEPAVRASYAQIVALLRGRQPALAREAVRQVLAVNDARSLARLQEANNE